MAAPMPLPDPWATWPQENPYYQFGPDIHENSTIDEIHAAYMTLLEQDLLDDGARWARGVLEKPASRLVFDLLLYDEETVRLLEQTPLPPEPQAVAEKTWHERLPLTWDF